MNGLEGVPCARSSLHGDAMTDDGTPTHIRPYDAGALAHLTRVGGTFAVAGHDGVVSDLRTKAVQGDVVVASTASPTLERGSRLSARAHDGHGTLNLVFVVEELERTSASRSDVLLRLVQTVDRGNERREDRFAVGSTGTARVVEPVAGGAGSAALPLTLVEASRSGLAFIVSRRLEAGEDVELSFDDGAGVQVRCRTEIVRVERVVYGRHRYAARITAASELDLRRLERMLIRLEQEERARAETAAVPQMVATGGRGGSLRRLFGQA